MLADLYFSIELMLSNMKTNRALVINSFRDDKNLDKDLETSEISLSSVNSFLVVDYQNAVHLFVC